MSAAHEVCSLATPVHGRYLLEVPDGADGAPWLVGFHGYGENATRHLAELRRLPGAEGWVLCAVESLHRFYNSKTGEVVGSWMTKEGRELAMADNLRYVASVLDELSRRLGPPSGLVFAGFSQGVAMAYRAAAGSGHPCQGLLALAGDVPPDVAERGLRAFPPVLLGRGEEDAWYSEEKMEADLETLAEGGVEVEACVFDGGHEWSEAFRDAAGAFLRRMAS